MRAIMAVTTEVMASFSRALPSTRTTLIQVHIFSPMINFTKYKACFTAYGHYGYAPGMSTIDDFLGRFNKLLLSKSTVMVTVVDGVMAKAGGKGWLSWSVLSDDSALHKCQ